MADWTGVSRTNFFRVKDGAAFEQAMSGHAVDLWKKEPEGEGTLYGLGAGSNEGYWPDWNDDGDEIDFPAIVAEHLADGEIVVFVSAGYEKHRYVTGHAIALDNTGKTVEVDIGDIYARAKETFGIEPSPAEY
ncbi:MAG: hypothetical protein GX595_20340 [Lentisphaerae bacterium]|nr:hypothetical protein [Lentisphaerota bacterium]